MPHAVTHVDPCSLRARLTGAVVPYGLIRQRVHTLGMSDAALETCTTMGDVHALLKPLYRACMRQTHPDHLSGRKTWRKGHLIRGVRFQRAKAAYDWLMACAPESRLRRGSPLPAPILEHDYPDIMFGFHVEYH